MKHFMIEVSKIIVAIALFKIIMMAIGAVA